MSKVLFDESPLVVDTVLATKIGLNEAIVLQQVHYWIEINRKKQVNLFDGFYWTYNSMKEWNKCFPFFGEKTLKRIFNNLEKLGILKTGNYNKLKMDRTKWYTINYAKLEECVNNDEQIEKGEGEGANGQNDLMQNPKRENAEGQNDPMEEDKMTQCKGSKCPNAKGQNDPTNTRDFTETSTETYTETSSTSISDVVDFFQNNFYLLKSFEVEVLGDWENRYPPELILEAMKIARKNNARSLTYIERILLNWDDQGIVSVEALNNYLKSKKENRHGNDSRNVKECDDQYTGIGLKLQDLQ